MKLRWTDVAVPLVLAAVAAAEIAGYSGAGRASALVVELFGCALLVARRLVPLPAATAAGAAAVGVSWVGPATDDLAATILIVAAATYALGRWLASWIGLAGVGAIGAVVAATYMLVDTRSHDITDAVFVMAILLPPYFFGRVARRLSVQAEQLRAQQDLVRREAVRSERDRIAREMHDVIAHSISAMVVQVAAARDLVRSRPDVAEQMLDSVTGTGRSAISETGRLLRVLRDNDDELGLAPAPGLRDLHELVEQFRTGGLDVDLAVDELAEVPTAVDVSAFRIVRECLTNAMRYSADGAVVLRVEADEEKLSISARNKASGAVGKGSGLGVVGMAERVELLGGNLTHGVAPTGEFIVSAELPL